MRLLTESSAPIKVWMSAFAISDTSSFQENAARLSIAVQNRQPMVAFLGRRQFSFTFSPLNERLHSFTSCHDDAGGSEGFDSSFVSFFGQSTHSPTWRLTDDDGHGSADGGVRGLGDDGVVL